MRLLPFPLPNSIVGKSILTCLAISFFIITFMKYYHVSHFLNFQFIAVSHYFSLQLPKKGRNKSLHNRRKSFFSFPFIKKALAWQQKMGRKFTRTEDTSFLEDPINPFSHNNHVLNTCYVPGSVLNALRLWPNLILIINQQCRIIIRDEETEAWLGLIKCAISSKQ